MRSRLIALSASLTIALGASQVEAQVTRFAYPQAVKDVVGSDDFKTMIPGLIAPQTATGVTFQANSSATFLDFGFVVEYDTAALAFLLGDNVTEDTLAQADFIAIDSNNGGMGFESSTWTFEDGENPPIMWTHNFGSGAGGPVLAESFKNPADPAAVLGRGGVNDYGYLLFDIDSDIDLFSSGFQVTLTGLGLQSNNTCGDQCPDVFLFAAVNTPEPSSVILTAVLGAFSLTKRRRPACH